MIKKIWRDSQYCLRAGCLSVRNRNLMVLARSKLRLASLTIGNTTTNVLGKPRITNQARAARGSRTRRVCAVCMYRGASTVHALPGHKDEL